jgi:hypothetical protein
VLTLFSGEQALAAAEARGPDELALLPIVFRENRILGGYRVRARPREAGQRGP